VITVFLFQSSAVTFGAATAQIIARQSTVPNALNSFMFSPAFSPTNSHGGGCGRTLYAVGSQEIFGRKIRQFVYRGKSFRVSVSGIELSITDHY
jgi:hypothetical protein